MKRIYRVKDKYGGIIEVMILDKCGKVPEDLVWLHFKKAKKENGWLMKPDEARMVIHGLFLAIDYIIEQYKLEKFRVKK